MQPEDVSEDLVDGGSRKRSPQEAREFEAANRLLTWVKSFLDNGAEEDWALTPGEPDNIFVATFGKGTKTFRAAVLLCDRGYGQQAGMLCRSLFEHAVVAWWMLRCVEDEEKEIMETLRQHKDHSRVLYFRAVAEHPELEIEQEEDEKFDDEYVTALDGRFGKYGGFWHGKRLDQLVREVAANVEEHHATMFWQFFRFVNGHNNTTIHHSAIGISDVVHWSDNDQVPVVELGPGPKWVSASLFAATAGYGLLVLATLHRLSPAKADEFSELVDELFAMFRSFSSDEVKDIGRNDPCPCESGLKFKQCHEPVIT